MAMKENLEGYSTFSADFVLLSGLTGILLI